MQVKVLQDVLSANDSLAQEIAILLKERGIFAFNLMSSPGSGKTTILERTLEMLQGRARLAVIEGDICTTADAERMAGYGIPVIQINTEHFGSACHLDARMIRKAVDALPLDDVDVLVVENVGNLVCPASFNLGTDRNAVVLSITEGEDKPLKYPKMFRIANVILVNKMDLAPHLGIDMDALRRNIALVNPDALCVELSASTGEGFSPWLEWILKCREAKRPL
jgi:hydrogenase nickel incorporation protein HypB